MKNSSPQPPSESRVFALLKVRIWLSEMLRLTELQTGLFWAGVIGFAGAILSVGFRKALNGMHWLFTHHVGGYVESFAHLSGWQRLVIPTVGGLLAGAVLAAGMRLQRSKSSTDYMEAIVLGDGHISVRSSLVKCGSALFSIASGASIGREGPLVQLSALAASLIGRFTRMPPLRLRLLVACGAAAGIASAYNAPIGGSLFVAEIILRSLAMETFGPLVFASVIATLTVHQLLGAGPLYEMHIPEVQLHSNWEMPLYLIFGLVCGAICALFLWLLRASERAFARPALPVYVKIALGGLCVGALAIVRPEVCGNGYTIITGALQGEYAWRILLLILALKFLATAASFGSGAVGGIFTPTLFFGACTGQLFALAANLLWPGAPLSPGAFTMVGMGAFLAAATQAPLMAILIVFEMTLDYPLILPLMLACVVAHYTARGFGAVSIYAESLTRKGAGEFQKTLGSLHVSDLMKLDPPCISETERFSSIAEKFLTQRFNYLYVIDSEHHFRGAVSLHDIKAYLRDPDLANIVMAGDILREDFATLAPETPAAEALAQFAMHPGERLPVVTSDERRELTGSVSKADLLLALAESAKTEQ